MAYLYGTRRAGRIDRCDESYVETLFSHWNFLPIYPRWSELTLREGEVIAIPRSARSILAAYARGWGWVPIVLSGLALGAFEGNQPTLLILVPAAFAVAWAATAFIGRLSAEEKRRRRAYRTVTGYACDPALLVDANRSLAEHLALELDMRAASLADDAYRASGSDWRTSTSSDPEFLALALTLSRIHRLDDVHASAWRRLAPQVDRLPPRIEPSTRGERTSTTSAPEPHRPAPGHVLPSSRGEAFERGWDVVVRDRAVIDDGRCASCLAPTSDKRASRRGSTRVEVPTCSSCSMHGYRSTHGRTAVLGIGITLGVVFALLGILPHAPWWVTAPIAAVLATALYVAMSLSKPPRRAESPATLQQTAARIVAARDGAITLHCTNETWARDLARRAGSESTPRKRLFAGALAGAWAVPFIVAPTTVFAFMISHPDVRIDNRTGKPVHVWVDGEDRGVFDEKLGAVEVGIGEHVFEWAHEGGPRTTTKESIALHPDKSHWWNPGARSCYWVEPYVYGSPRNVPAVVTLTRRELHTHDRIHDWFSDPPREMKVDGSGMVRLVLRRDPRCERSCDDSVVDTYWSCIRSALDDDAIRACRETFDEECSAPSAK